ncbi:MULTISPECIES: hypothetical protein [unclassified Pseudomonas]|uniref:hypothetical protein n=1 Tax=unclassified Pseudomonas TaxID=196821 RepID=UPI0035C24651
MSKPMKRSAFFLSAAVAALLAVHAPSSWSSDNHDQHAQKPSDATRSDGSKRQQAQGMNHEGMDHGSMKGMDHGAMEGMDHGKMMESHGSDKAKAGKNGQ